MARRVELHVFAKTQHSILFQFQIFERIRLACFLVTLDAAIGQRNPISKQIQISRTIRAPHFSLFGFQGRIFFDLMPMKQRQLHAFPSKPETFYLANDNADTIIITKLILFHDIRRDFLRQKRRVY
jgi:hypothetical protein